MAFVRASIAAAGLLLAVQLVHAESDLDGVWMLDQLTGDPYVLTEAGQKQMDAYDYMTDDPALKCSPASFARIVFTPQTYMEIRVLDDAVEIDYEFMDVKRRVLLDAELTTRSAPHSVPVHPHLGRSIARFESSELVIETEGYEPGVITTLNQRAGMPRSAGMWTEERFSVEGDQLSIELVHVDPVYYEGEVVLHATYLKTDDELLEFGCDLEDADHYNE